MTEQWTCGHVAGAMCGECYRQLAMHGGELTVKADKLEDTLHRIKQWCEAYPLEVFPEPDLDVARMLLEDGGISLDAVSASNMRHVLTGIKKIIEEGAEA